MKVASTNPTGAQNAPPRRACRAVTRLGFCNRNAPKASGAPAYISTEALVTTPTRLDHDGNGSRKTNPIRAVMMIANAGTLPRDVVRSNASGM